MAVDGAVKPKFTQLHRRIQRLRQRVFAHPELREKVMLLEDQLRHLGVEQLPVARAGSEGTPIGFQPMPSDPHVPLDEALKLAANAAWFFRTSRAEWTRVFIQQLERHGFAITPEGDWDALEAIEILHSYRPKVNTHDLAEKIDARLHDAASPARTKIIQDIIEMTLRARTTTPTED
jgi:hypothetical protein